VRCDWRPGWWLVAARWKKVETRDPDFRDRGLYWYIVPQSLFPCLRLPALACPCFLCLALPCLAQPCPALPCLAFLRLGSSDPIKQAGWLGWVAGLLASPAVLVDPSLPPSLTSHALMLAIHLLCVALHLLSFAVCASLHPSTDPAFADALVRGCTDHPRYLQ
jgi:hypothetical protein